MKWHYRLGHLNVNDMKRLEKANVLPKIHTNELKATFNCEVCLKAKMTALPFDESRNPCGEILKIVHSDVVGPFRTESTERAKYFVTFIDDCSRWCEVYFLREKGCVLDAFKMYQ